MDSAAPVRKIARTFTSSALAFPRHVDYACALTRPDPRPRVDSIVAVIAVLLLIALGLFILP